MAVTGEVSPGAGSTPAIVLANPKYGHNAAGALRVAASYGFSQLWITGDRILSEWTERKRLPREERMKAYGDVDVIVCNRPFDAWQGTGATIIGVEVVPNAEPLTIFQHPENAVYVFGPEDGGLSKVERSFCHRFVIIPSAHCLNLAVAVGTVAYDRRAKRQAAGLEEVRPSYATLDEQRGFWDGDEELR